MNKISTILTSAAAFFMPFVAAAQSGINTSVVRGYSDGIINVINGILVPVLLAIAFIVFIYGVFNYFILGAADEKKREDGRKFTMWGVIGFVIIFSIWGLVAIVTQTFGLSDTGSPRAPTFNAQGGGGSGGCMPPYYWEPDLQTCVSG